MSRKLTDQPLSDTERRVLALLNEPELEGRHAAYDRRAPVFAELAGTADLDAALSKLTRRKHVDEGHDGSNPTFEMTDQGRKALEQAIVDG